MSHFVLDPNLLPGIEMVKTALLIGVSQYEVGLNPLPGSVRDVDALQRVLADPELGGFAEADITVLKNPQRQEMEDEIYRLFSERKKDDLLLFYFSGHGIKDENGRLYLATRVTRKGTNGRLVKPSAVATTSLHENINESRSQRQVIILDCCFSGAIAQGMTVKDDGTVNLKEYLGGKGRAILTSSTSTEYSFGAAAGHDEAGLSIYTRYLVEGIETGAADLGGDGWIAVEELHEYAASRVKKVAPAMTPKFYPVEEGYKIVLSRARKDDPKLKYRKEVQARSEQGKGQLSVIAQRLLRSKRIEWGIDDDEAKAIEDEVLKPAREYACKQKEYEQVLAEIAQASYPLSATVDDELKEYQQHLGLRDSDIAAIKTRVLASFDAEHKRQQQEELERQQLLEQQRREEVQTWHKDQASHGDELASEKGVDYTRLRDLLEAGQWKEADQETSQVLLKAGGEERQGYILGHELDQFPCTDLRTIDQLWLKYSDGKFGFSVQRKIWDEVGQNLEKFRQHVDPRGRTGKLYHNFSLGAPSGHLPLASRFAYLDGGKFQVDVGGGGSLGYPWLFFSRIEACKV